MVSLGLKDKNLDYEASFYFYSFICSFGTVHVGRNTKSLSEGTREHHPGWFGNATEKSRNGAMVSRLAQTDWIRSVKQASRALYWVWGQQSMLPNCRAFSRAKAMGIRLQNSPLGTESILLLSFNSLGWPAPSIQNLNQTLIYTACSFVFRCSMDHHQFLPFPHFCPTNLILLKILPNILHYNGRSTSHWKRSCSSTFVFPFIYICSVYLYKKSQTFKSY